MTRKSVMIEASIYEAKTRLSALLQAVAEGEEVVITNRNRPVARLVPYAQPKRRPVFGAARQAMKREGFTDADVDRVLAPMGDAEVKEWGLG